MLNFAREEVPRVHLASGWTGFCTENNIRFIKWDMNRYVSEAGWPEAAARCSASCSSAMRNLIEIFDPARALPPVVFESCSSGGGRAIRANPVLAEQIWTSDNTDPGDRLHIQYGYSLGVPGPQHGQLDHR